MNKKIKQLAFRFFIVAMAFLSSADAMAATQTVTVNIAFDTPLSLSLVSNVNFGTVAAGVNSTYTITTAGTVTATGSGQALYGTKSAGNIKIAGSATATINISVGGYTANGGVTPQNATCSYNGAPAGSCTINTASAPGTGKTLLIGLEAVVDGTQHAASTATPSFTVTVNYT